MIVEYIRYQIPESQSTDFERAYSRSANLAPGITTLPWLGGNSMRRRSDYVDGSHRVDDY